LSNLDAKLRVQMRAEIKKLHRHLGTTMIYVTHDQVEAMTMGDRITVMKDGDVHQVDAPIALYNNPADTFVAGFIGSPAMNFIPARVLEDGEILLIAGDIPVTTPETHRELLTEHRGEHVTLGLRPEHVRATPDACGHPVHIKLEHMMSEMLGNEMYLYLSTAQLRITGRSSVVRQIDIGATVDMYFDMARAHYFNSASGAQLTLHVH
ncbi:MAG: TOBE domain-containing protein, partial [Bacteroidota bacterium]